MKLRRMILTVMAAMAMALAPAHDAAARVAAPDGWEEVARRPLADGASYGVTTAGEWVYVTSAGAVKASLLTVLGQRVTEVTLPAGTHRFRLSARGIYILRLGSSTYRITL